MKLIIVFIIGFSCSLSQAKNVLMVIGGQFFNTTSREHQVLASVEVVGFKSPCQVRNLPIPLYGMTAGRVGNSVLVCGGYYYTYRSECFEWSPRSNRWQVSRVRLEKPNAFMSSLSYNGDFFMLGGRNYVGTDPNSDGRNQSDWKYYDALWRLNGDRFEQIALLPEPLSDACAVVTKTNGKKRMWLIGGSNRPQRYKATVYTVDLDSEHKQWRRMTDMPESRMWHQCTYTQIQGVKGILVVGGYYNGGSTMWLPLLDRYGNSLETDGLNRDQPKWEWMSTLTSGRKWGAGLGYIGGQVVVAGGGDYGDETVEVLHGREFQRRSVNMTDKREFLSGVTVPSEWFPTCN